MRREIARRVLGPVKDRFGVVAEWIGNEFLGRQLGAVEIAARHAGAADVQLSGNANGHRLELRVQQINPRIENRPADGNSPLETSSLASPERGVDAGFSGSVKIDQVRRQAVEKALHQFRR